ncbi:hypothetical protein BGZ83_007938 [Gryganskiella cystojenkinii]|nr:hypothetical protein BGZ83_007938 [Gryganskiella cystojenkinii]
MERSPVGKDDIERIHATNFEAQTPTTTKSKTTITITKRSTSDPFTDSMVVLTSERDRSSGGNDDADSDGGEQQQLQQPEGKHGRHNHHQQQYQQHQEHKEQEHRGRELEPDNQDYSQGGQRRSRSGRPLRSTVQYDERASSRSSSMESNSGSRRQQKPYRSYGGDESQQHVQSSEAQEDESQRKARYGPGSNGSPSDEDQQQQRHQQQQQHRDQRYDDDGEGDGRDELMSDEEQDEDGFGGGGDGANEDGSESMDTNSSKNDDGTEPLVVSMYGSPSLVKVRSMFIDKLYKMVEDQSIQHLISWAKEGDMFYVFNCVELSTTVLPKFFKHNNWQSFVRQLNIYRYDREESTMNRRNPETQRWQFYHPDFQRDRPHLRSNIKRKSARSINLAPTFSRVVFERDKGGYYIQQEPPSRAAGAGGLPPGHQGSHPPPGSVGLLHPQQHNLVGDGQRIAPRPSSDYRSSPHHSESGYPRDDPRYHSSSSRPPDMRHDYGPPPSHMSPHQQHQQQQHNISGHPSQQQPYPHSGGPHQRQHSYAGPPSQTQRHHRPDHPYGGYPPQHLPQARPVGHPSRHPDRPPTENSPSGLVREAEQHHGYPDYVHGAKGGMAVSGGHNRSQSAPGLDPRRELSRVPHPLSQPEHHSRPSPQSTPQSYFPREPYTPQPRTSHGSYEGKPPVESAGTPGEVAAAAANSHRGSLQKHPLSPSEQQHPMPSSSGSDRAPPGPPSASGLPPFSEQPWAQQQGRSPDEFSSRNRHTPPSGPTHPVPPPPGSGSVQRLAGGLQPPHAVDSIPTTPSSGPPGAIDSSLSNSHVPGSVTSPNAHDLVPRTMIKDLESRLHFVEDAYMSLRQFAQELQQIQHHQEQTIAWMRDRIQQMTDMSPRDTMTSPPQQTGVVPAKRKVEYGAEDGREWGGRRAIESAGDRSGPVTPGSGPGYPVGGPGGPPNSGARYEGFHPSFSPHSGPAPPPNQQQQQHPHHHPHHQSPHQPHPQLVQHHAHPHQQQQQQPPHSRQQPSPLMNEPPQPPPPGAPTHHTKVPRHD